MVNLLKVLISRRRADQRKNSLPVEALLIRGDVAQREDEEDLSS